MTAVKAELKGMNRRVNQTVQTVDSAFAVVNLEQDKLGNWCTRSGSQVEYVSAGVLDKVWYKGPLSGGNKLIDLHSTGPYHGLIQIPYAGAAPATPPNWVGPVSFAEYNNVLYWTDPNGNMDMWKFDGFMHYRAGVPAARASTAAAAGARYYRVAIKYTDQQGNEQFGNYAQLGPYANNATLNVDTLAGTQFWNRYAINTGVNTNFNQTPPDDTMTAAGHTYQAGDWVRVLDVTTDLFFNIQIASVVPGVSITFDFGPHPGKSFIINNGQLLEQDRALFYVWISATPTYGYVFQGSFPMLNNATTQNLATGAASVNALPMSVEYNDEDAFNKTLPVRCRYLTIYGNVMCLASAVGTEEADKDRNRIYYSNLLAGSSVESFSPLDSEIIGKTSEGAIAAVFGGDYALIVLKEKQIYFLSGVLVQKAYTIVSALTNGVGCLFHKSVGELMGGCFFMSQKGIYSANGQVVAEVSDVIEPFLTSGVFDLAKCRALTLPSREKGHMFVPGMTFADDIILSYDTYWENWSYQTGRHCQNGFVNFQEKIHWGDGNNQMTEAVAFTDAGALIPAYWESHFCDFGDPVLKKKFTKFALVSMATVAWTAYIQTFINWLTNVETNEVMNITPTDRVVDAPLSMAKSYCMKFRFGCQTLGQQAVISHVQTTVEGVQATVTAEA